MLQIFEKAIDAPSKESQCRHHQELKQSEVPNLVFESLRLRFYHCLPNCLMQEQKGAQKKRISLCEDAIHQVGAKKAIKTNRHKNTKASPSYFLFH